MSDSSDTVTAKAVAMCILFVASMVLGTIPIKLSHWFNWKSGAKDNTYVQLLLCLGGGVLLCTTFIHLLPEVVENLEQLEDFPDTHLPFAHFLLCVGFFTMYFIEECAHVYLHKTENRKHLHSARSSISISRGQLGCNSNEKLMASLEEPKIKTEYHDHIDHSHEGHSHVMIEDSTIITMRGLLVVLALSIHELFEGLAVGLESSSVHVWFMFGAVSAHKLVIAFCIGIELVSSGMRTVLIVIYIFIFAVVSPIGIGIGIAITEEQHASTALISVILQGLASGTLLYVVFFEILREERKTGIKQYFATVLGFLIMLGISFAESE